MTADHRRGVLYGLIVTAAFAAIDIALGTRAAIPASYVLGAIVAGVLAGLRPALLVGGFAFALAVASPIWNAGFGTTGYFARLFVAAATAFLAAGAGQLRDDLVDQLGRQQLLAAMADLPESGADLTRTVRSVLEHLVPRYARFAAIERELDGHSVRVASRGTEPLDSTAAQRTALRARGRVIATLVTSGGRGGLQDPRFLPTAAGRIALALDNAGLSAELVSVEQQMRAIVENLAEAVTVQDADAQVVFANRAAADLLGASSPAELLAGGPGEFAERFVISKEDGNPVDLAELPGRAVLAGREVPPLTLRILNRATGEEGWRVTKATAIRDVDGQVVFAVNVIEDVTESKRAELAQRLLADASAALASSLDYERTLQRVAELAVPALADWCALGVPRGDVIEQVAVAHADPTMRALAEDYARRWPVRVDEPGGPAEVLRTGRPQLLAELSDQKLADAALSPEQRAALHELGLRSVIVVPLSTPERTVGILSLATGASGRRFSPSDIELARELGRRAAAAIENARLYSERTRVAATLQRTLLPPALPSVPGWRFGSLYLPAGEETEVGGDFYDVFRTPAGWMAVMGDVVGRGAAAASLTAMGRYTLRTAGSLVGTPTLALARLNENLRERNEMALCTVVVVLLSEDTSEATIVCAGHPLPYLVRGGVVEAVGLTGPLLGAFEHGEWLPATLELQPGDLLVLYTDGVPDTRAADDRFGQERLEAALTGAASADEAVARIHSALREFAGDEHEDDTAVLALQKL